MVVVHEVGMELVGLAGEEPVEAFEAAAERPAVTRRTPSSCPMAGVRCHLPTANVAYPLRTSISERKPFSCGIVAL